MAARESNLTALASILIDTRAWLNEHPRRIP
jgi:hypothetical protein